MHGRPNRSSPTRKELSFMGGTRCQEPGTRQRHTAVPVSRHLTVVPLGNCSFRSRGFGSRLLQICSSNGEDLLIGSLPTAGGISHHWWDFPPLTGSRSSAIPSWMLRMPMDTIPQADNVTTATTEGVDASTAIPQVEQVVTTGRTQSCRGRAQNSSRSRP